jgi:formiminoglutamase
VGVPTFRTSISATAAYETPAAVRAALRFYSEHGESETIPTKADWGDVVDPDGDRDAATAFVARVASSSRLLVALGGDNSLSVPVALGTWGQRVSTAGLVTLDAHHDIRDGRSNGSPVRELIEAGLAGTRVVQVGISDFANSREYARRAADFGITVVRRDALGGRPMGDVMTEALERAASAGGPVHVDLDVDVCDRSVAPACPAAVPGGISAHELRTAARVAGAFGAVESIDIAEIDATRDSPDARTVRLAALLVLEALAGLAERV